MARGPKKHMKRLAAPKHWMLNKLGGTWAPRPSQGPHKMRECLPLSLILRNRLKYALTGRECLMIVMRRLVEVDGKVRTDVNFPAGFMDVITLARTKDKYRLLYDVKGRFVLHRIDSKESTFKLLKVVKKTTGKKASIGQNPYMKGQQAAIPFLVSHDGRTIKYPMPNIKLKDTIKYEIKTGKILEHYSFKVGNICMCTGGANMGRVGVIAKLENHPGSFNIIHVRDATGSAFATRESNVFVIGNGNESAVSLPKGKGVKIDIAKDREIRMSKQSK